MEKATRCRLLDELLAAESICRDILAVEAENQDALVTLLLAVTDQFEKTLARTFNDDKVLLPSIKGEYERVVLRGNYQRALLG